MIIIATAKSKNWKKEKSKLKAYWRLLHPKDYTDKLIGQKMIEPIKR